MSGIFILFLVIWAWSDYLWLSIENILSCNRPLFLHTYWPDLASSEFQHWPVIVITVNILSLSIIIDNRYTPFFLLTPTHQLYLLCGSSLKLVQTSLDTPILHYIHYSTLLMATHARPLHTLTEQGFIYQRVWSWQFSNLNSILHLTILIRVIRLLSIPRIVHVDDGDVLDQKFIVWVLVGLWSGRLLFQKAPLPRLPHQTPIVLFWLLPFLHWGIWLYWQLGWRGKRLCCFVFLIVVLILSSLACWWWLVQHQFHFLLLGKSFAEVEVFLYRVEPFVEFVVIRGIVCLLIDFTIEWACYLNVVVFVTKRDIRFIHQNYPMKS